MATLNVRLDEKLKREAFVVLDELGVSPSDLIRNLFRYVAEHQQLPVKLIPLDQDNLQATQTIWKSYSLARASLLQLIDRLKVDKNIPVVGLNELAVSVDKVVEVSNKQAERLVKIKEWSQACAELQKLTYQMKCSGLASSLGSDYLMYSTVAISELSETFYRLDLATHELMLHSRCL